MTPFILKRWPRFDNFMALFTTKLGKPAQRHFIALIMAFIIYDGRKNIASLNRALFARAILPRCGALLAKASGMNKP